MPPPGEGGRVPAPGGEARRPSRRRPLPGRRGIIGSPEKVRAELERLAVEYGAEEVIVVTITHDHDARRRSYELLADAFGLEPSVDARVDTDRRAAAARADLDQVA